MDVLDLHAESWSRVESGRARMAHAVLFAGPAGNFKADFAHAVAASLLCETPQTSGRACAHCLACNWFGQGNHPDFRWLRPEAMDEAKTAEEGGKAAKDGKASREITIDQVRALSDFLNVGTHRAGSRVILVTPAEAMNRNTANALLKSLEEPKPGTIFLLVSDHPDRLLPTIRSRCRVQPIPRPAGDLARSFLAEKGVANAERWLALAGGAPRLAMEVATGNQKRLLETLEAHLQHGAALDPIRLALDLDGLLKADRSLGAYDVIEWTQRWTHDLAQSSCGLPPSYYSHAEAVVRRLAGQTGFQRLSTFVRKTTDFKRLAQHPLNTRLFFEDFFSEYLAVFR
ncbi:MAG TPA: DNA polymerase III subunit delta' [Rhodocyclaceae bacterium]|nr:DNA polymerase III subunit delta' [Rhodocyclaceae bacterium]